MIRRRTGGRRGRRRCRAGPSRASALPIGLADQAATSGVEGLADHAADVVGAEDAADRARPTARPSSARCARPPALGPAAVARSRAAAAGFGQRRRRCPRAAVTGCRCRAQTARPRAASSSRTAAITNSGMRAETEAAAYPRRGTAADDAQLGAGHLPAEALRPRSPAPRRPGRARYSHPGAARDRLASSSATASSAAVARLSGRLDHRHAHHRLAGACRRGRPAAAAHRRSRDHRQRRRARADGALRVRPSLPKPNWRRAPHRRRRGPAAGPQRPPARRQSCAAAPRRPRRSRHRRARAGTAGVCKLDAADGCSSRADGSGAARRSGRVARLLDRRHARLRRAHACQPLQPNQTASHAASAIASSGSGWIAAAPASFHVPMRDPSRSSNSSPRSAHAGVAEATGAARAFLEFIHHPERRPHDRQEHQLRDAVPGLRS